MPKYRSHKEVHALKLRQVQRVGPQMEFHPDEDGYATIQHPLDAEVSKRCKAIEMSDPGYIVVYSDGFTSWSPTKAFEDGYTRI